MIGVICELMEKGSYFVRKIKIFLGCVVLLGIIVSLLPARITAQTIGVQLFRIFATRGNGLPISIPTPYLRSTHITTGTTVLVKTNVAASGLTPASAGTGVIGCVTIGVAGAAASTVKLYNSRTADANELLATVDGAAVRQLCYGMIFSEALTVVVASGGTVPDVVVTWR